MAASGWQWLLDSPLENAVPCWMMTRSPAARISNASCETASIDLARGRIPLVEINNHAGLSAGLTIEKTAAQKTEKAASANESSLDGEYCVETLQLLSQASQLFDPDIPLIVMIKDGQCARKLKIANVAIINTTETEKPSSPTEELPRTPKANRQSVRRSLMGRTSMNKASLVQRCSLASERERSTQKTINRRTTSGTSTAREQSSSCRRVSCRVSLEKLPEDMVESRLQLDPASHSHQEVADQPFSHSHKVPKAAAIEERQDGKSKENSSEKNAEVQERPGRCKATYKRTVKELYDGQHTEAELSCPRKKSSSPQCPASKVAHPFKTFLCTVRKKCGFMKNPGSASQNSATTSFHEANQTNLKEKERHRFEILKKVKEEKRQRLEKMKRKHEECVRKVQQARERLFQRDEENKYLLEQKHIGSFFKKKRLHL